MYCVDSGNRALHGAAAAEYACARSPNRKKFVQNNPGLFEYTGWGHHPYSYNTAPDRPYSDPTWLTLDNLGSLESLLNGIFNSYGMGRRGGLPMYITEWGYKTKPPNPYSRTSWAEQARWLDQGDYMLWGNPHVRSITQFLLYDDQPDRTQPVGSKSYWGTFQTGLIDLSNHKKTAYYGYRVPIWLPSERHGAHVTVWGQLRMAPNGTLQYAALVFRKKGSHTWKTLAELQTSNPEGYLLNHVSIPSAGDVKLGWLDPHSGKTYYSRTVHVY